MRVGLCRQVELDAAVRKAGEKKQQDAAEVMSSEERMALLSTDESLAAKPEPRIPRSMEGLESFSLIEDDAAADEDPRGKDDPVNPDDLFNLPGGGGDQPDEDDDQPR